MDAKAIEIDEEIVVLRDSIGTSQEFKTNQYASLRQQLIDEGKLQLIPGNGIRFMEDVPFSSLSAAAAVLNNRNSSGPRKWWLLETSQTLGDWRDAMLEASAKPAI